LLLAVLAKACPSMLGVLGLAIRRAMYEMIGSPRRRVAFRCSVKWTRLKMGKLRSLRSDHGGVN